MLFVIGYTIAFLCETFGLSEEHRLVANVAGTALENFMTYPPQPSTKKEVVPPGATCKHGNVGFCGFCLAEE